jgi:hypothetical protein
LNCRRPCQKSTFTVVLPGRCLVKLATRARDLSIRLLETLKVSCRTAIGKPIDLLVASIRSTPASRKCYCCIFLFVFLSPPYGLYCRLHVTGHSLGGAIATLFGFYAATDPTITKDGPVMLYTFASPRLGGRSFQEVFKYLERRGNIRHARIHNKKDKGTSFSCFFKGNSCGHHSFVPSYHVAGFVLVVSSSTTPVFSRIVQARWDGDPASSQETASI